jgi:hypothetical protein
MIAGFRHCHDGSTPAGDKPKVPFRLAACRFMIRVPCDLRQRLAADSFIELKYAVRGNLGSVYCLLVDKKEAERCLRMALTVNPDYQTAIDNLSVLKRTSVKRMKEMAKGKKLKFKKS